MLFSRIHSCSPTLSFTLSLSLSLSHTHTRSQVRDLRTALDLNTTTNANTTSKSKNNSKRKSSETTGYERDEPASEGDAADTGAHSAACQNISPQVNYP